MRQFCDRTAAAIPVTPGWPILLGLATAILAEFTCMLGAYCQRKLALYRPAHPSRYRCSDLDVREVDRYFARCDITLGRTPVPADDIHAFDARAVVNRLGPGIEYPE